MGFLLKVVEMGGGKTDIKGLAGELGMKLSAVNMRMTRLRKKFGRPSGNTGAGDSELALCWCIVCSLMWETWER